MTTLLQNPRLALAVSTGIALIVAVVTRPDPRRLIGAVVGIVLFIALNVLCDVIAHAAGWWQYPASVGTIQPLWVYAVQDIVFGSLTTLVAWRVERRFQVRGVVVFLLIFATFAAARDTRYAATTDIITFAPGIAPVLADWACAAILGLLSYLVMRLVAGPVTLELPPASA